jgi:hypothetical protein
MAEAQDPNDYADMENAIKILTEAIAGDTVADMPVYTDEFPTCQICENIDPYASVDSCYLLTFTDCMEASDCLVADDFNCWNDEMGIDATVPDTPVVDPCQCFANGAENEDFCETGDMLYDVVSCVADDRCHWGPGEIEECGMMNVDEAEPEEAFVPPTVNGISCADYYYYSPWKDSNGYKCWAYEDLDDKYCDYYADINGYTARHCCEVCWS